MTSGGFFGTITKPKEGTIIKIKYQHGNSYKLIRNDSLKVSANYKITVGEGDYDKFIYSDISTFDSYYFGGQPEYVLYYSPDSLVIWDGCMDGLFSHYIKE